MFQGNMFCLNVFKRSLIGQLLFVVYLHTLYLKKYKEVVFKKLHHRNQLGID